jgi:hypothetical protein
MSGIPQSQYMRGSTSTTPSLKSYLLLSPRAGQGQGDELNENTLARRNIQVVRITQVAGITQVARITMAVEINGLPVAHLVNKTILNPPGQHIIHQKKPTHLEAGPLPTAGCTAQTSTPEAHHPGGNK